MMPNKRVSRKNADEEDSEALREQFLLGHTHLETLEIQAAHLTKIQNWDASIYQGPNSVH